MINVGMTSWLLVFKYVGSIGCVRFQVLQVCIARNWANRVTNVRQEKIKEVDDKEDEILE